ncbi:MAG: alpha/beta fold hydrolase [Acidobacteriota bacterium]
MTEKKKGGWWSLALLAGAGLAAAGLWTQKRSRRLAAAQRALPPAQPAARPTAAPRPAAGPAAPQPAPEAAALAMPEDLETSWIAGPAGTLKVCQRHSDASAALIFVHGLGGSLSQWSAALASLGENWRGVAFDLPGHGGSDAAGEITIDLLASSISAVVDGLGLRRVVLVAHSLGTAAAIRYAGRQRHRVAGLLLVDPNGDQTELPVTDRRQLLESVAEDAHEELGAHFRQIVGEAHSPVGRKVLGDLESTPPEVLLECLRAGFAYSPLDDLDRYAGPMRLILSPLNDLPYSLHKLRPQLRVAVLHNVNHWLMLEEPGAFARLLDHFLESVGGRVDQVN